jgi:hypothetical protein
MHAAVSWTGTCLCLPPCLSPCLSASLPACLPLCVCVCLLARVLAADGLTAELLTAGGRAQPFEPEGLLSGLATIVTTWVGCHFGLTLLHIQQLQAESEQQVAIVEEASAPFPSWDRSIVTEIYLCHACFYHEIEGGNGAPGGGGGAAGLALTRGGARGGADVVLSVRGAHSGGGD